jgi:hypothetical protein
MPNEVNAFRRYFEDEKKKAQAKAKRRRTLSPRRADMSTCDANTDRTKNGLRFKTGSCCKKLNCVGKYNPRQVLMLRKALANRPRNSVDRRAFLSKRHKATLRYPNSSRGSGKFFCDSVTTLSLNTYLTVSEEQDLPLEPLDLQQVCASFFCWAYGVSKDQMRNNLPDRLDYSKRMLTVPAPKQWSIEQWLVDISQYYQLQPDSEIVLLPFANRASVYL